MKLQMNLARSAFVLAIGLLPNCVEHVSGDDHKPSVLMVTESRGFVHNPVKRPEGQLAPCEVAMRQLSLDSGAFTVEHSQDSATAVTAENLKRFDVVLFYTTGNLPIESAEMDYFINDWLKQPKHGFIGIHSATDTLKDDPRYVELAGGNFNGHPWTQNTEVTIVVHEPTHPTVAPFGTEIRMQEEIYQYNRFVPSNVRVLMSLDMSRSAVKRPYHVPVAWVRSWGEGRVFINNMGHRPETWLDKRFLQSMVAGIQWTAGLIDGPTAVNPELSEAQDKKAAADCLAVGITPETVAAEEALKAAQRLEQAKNKKAAAKQ